LFKYKLKPRIDYTNSENIYTRNIIRNKIIPELQEINPNIIRTLSRTSKIIKENNRYLKKQSQEIYGKLAKLETKKTSFDLKEFNKLERTIKTNIILQAIEELQGTPRNIEKTNIDDIIKLAKRNVGNKYIKINKNLEAKIQDKKLQLTFLENLKQ